MDKDTAASDAAEAVWRGEDVRERVRDLTLRALRDRSLKLDDVRAVVSAMTEGAAQGAQRTADLRKSLGNAFAGLDQALTKSAEAARLALQELGGRGRELRETELREAEEHLKKLEEEFLSTVSQVADRSEERVKAALHDLVTHARRSGTDTGAMAREAWAEASGRARTLAAGGAQAARETTGRFLDVASGILGGMADAMEARAKNLHGQKGGKK